MDSNAAIGYDGNKSPVTATADAGIDYSSIECYYTQRGRGTGDNLLTFQSTTGGSLHQLYAIYLEGDMKEPLEQDT